MIISMHTDCLQQVRYFLVTLNSLPLPMPQHNGPTKVNQVSGRSIAHNNSTSGISYPAVAPVWQTDASRSIVQGVFTADNESDIQLVADYLEKMRPELVAGFTLVRNAVETTPLNTWLTDNQLLMPDISRWARKRKPDTIEPTKEVEGPALEIENRIADAVAEEKEEERPLVGIPNAQRVRVGQKGFGVFNLFTYAGTAWIATAYHCIQDIDGYFTDGGWKNYPKVGEENAPDFFVKNGWSTEAAVLVDSSPTDDYVLYRVTTPTGGYPLIRLGTVSSAASEDLIVNTPRVPGGVAVKTKLLPKKRRTNVTAPDRYVYENGVANYAVSTDDTSKKTMPGDSGAAVTNINGEFVGIHQTDFGGITFQEGRGILKALSEANGLD